MSETIDTCPSENELLDFGSGHAPERLAGHLSNCERCRRTVALLVTQGPSVRTSLLEAGARIGRYEVLRAIGEGGMGRVFAARDPVLERTVAVKLLHAWGEGALARARLLREARTLASVSHPNLVSIYDAGEVDGSVYLAMELVEGQTLRTWRHHTARKPEDVLSAYLAAGEGLAAVHDAGLVHRDFKPDNVLMGADGRVKVSDFGLARSIDEQPVRLEVSTDGESDAVKTTLAGTPAYMAPEQAAGKACDARSDQFAFCVSLLEGLSGARPSEPGGQDALIATQPPRIRKALRQGLALDPSQRFPSMRALLQALRPRLGRRQLVAASVAGALVLALAAAAVSRVAAPVPCSEFRERSGAVMSAERWKTLEAHFASLGTDGTARLAAARGLFSRYEDAWVAEAQQNCQAERVQGQQGRVVSLDRAACLDRRLADLDAALDVLRTSTAENFARSVDVAASLTPVAACASTGSGAISTTDDQHGAAEERAAVDRELAAGEALIAAGRLAEALERARLASSSAATHGWPSREAEARLLEGRVERQQGSAEAAAHFRLAWERAFTAHSLRTAMLVAGNLGVTLKLRGKEEAGAEWMAQARALAAQATEDLELQFRLERFETQFAPEATPEVTLSHGQRALRLAEQLYPEGHPRVLNSLLPLAAALGHLYRYEESLALYRRVLAATPANQSTGGADRSLAVMGAAAQLANLRRPAEAEALIREALAPATTAFGADSVQVARLRLMLAPLERRQGRAQASWDDCEAARQVLERTDTAVELIDLFITRGEAESDLGRWEDAHRSYERARALVKEFGDDEPSMAVALESEGERLLAHGRAATAVPLLRDALARRSRGSDAPMMAYAQSLLGRALAATGHAAEARTLLLVGVQVLSTSHLDPDALEAAQVTLAALPPASPRP